VFLLLNIRTPPFFLTNTLHIIRRESWKIHITIPTISLPLVEWLSPATQRVRCNKWVMPPETTEQGQCQSFFSYIEVNADNHIQGESFLTYGTADGSIRAVKLRQPFSLPTSLSELFESPQYAITERASSWVYEPDYSGITALQWVNASDHDVWFSVSILAVYIVQYILVHCTPGLMFDSQLGQYFVGRRTRLG
jgi:hypothetical protein